MARLVLNLRLPDFSGGLRGAMLALRNILVATDFSEPSVWRSRMDETWPATTTRGYT